MSTNFKRKYVMPKETKTEQVMTRITKTTRNKLNKLAAKYHMTASRFICHLIEKAR